MLSAAPAQLTAAAEAVVRMRGHHTCCLRAPAAQPTEQHKNQVSAAAVLAVTHLLRFCDVQLQQHDEL